MGKALVIVESPAKAKTINKYLGRDFVVKSSVGHIRDLPTSGNARTTDAAERARSAAATRKMSEKDKATHREKKGREQLVKRMGVDPGHGWRANYEILPGKEKVVADLRKAASTADAIYLATDLDREGEAIAWHLREAIGGDPAKYRRVVFNEITRSAIKEAFERPSQVDMDRVNAQQARRFLDRVVGYMLSPLLWEKVARGLSAGRVQSVAVQLLVEREREIRAFVPEEFWELHADTLTAAKEALRLEVRREGEQNFRPGNREEAERAVRALEKARYVVRAREDKPTRTRPSAPFITSTLQQAASTRLGFSVKKTMMLAQRLYEAGFITYMRTDSTNLSAEAVAACRDYIGAQHGAKYVPEKPSVYSSKAGAQEAHEAIRPSDVTLVPDALEGVERDAVKVYELIWRQFVACQMPAAEYLSTSLEVVAGDFELRARGRILKFDGFLRVLPAGQRKDEDVELPDVAVGAELALQQLVPSQHFTKPPPRYTEATLVRELEKRGIGRPSTYASIISTIQDRGYARVESRRFYAEKLGDIVTDRLAEKFTNLMDYGFTASMEESLDEVASGERNWIKVLDDFYADFSGRLEAAKVADGGMRGNLPVGTDIKCPALRTADADPHRQHRRVPGLLRLFAAAHGALQGDHQPGARRRGRARRGRRGRGGRVQGAAHAPSLHAVRHRDGQLPGRCAAQAARLRQQSRLPGLRDRDRPFQAQGLRRSADPLRQVRRGHAAQDRPLRQVLRLHRERLRQHAQAPAQRAARAAQDAAGADAAPEVPEGRRLLRAARWRVGPVPGGQPLSEEPRDARAAGRGTAVGARPARSQVRLPARCAGARRRGQSGADPLQPQDAPPVRDERGRRQANGLARLRA